MTTIAAVFAVGFSDQSWQHAGPYYGDGETFERACLDALCKCAVEFEERETEFMTFLGRPKVVERPHEPLIDDFVTRELEQKFCG